MVKLIGKLAILIYLEGSILQLYRLQPVLDLRVALEILPVNLYNQRPVGNAAYLLMTSECPSYIVSSADLTAQKAEME